MRHRRREPAPRPIEPACPTWCTRDHGLDLLDADGMLLHCRTISPGIELVAVDDLEAGHRTAPEITVASMSGGTGRWAQRVALAILDAADYLEDGAQ